MENWRVVTGQTTVSKIKLPIQRNVDILPTIPMCRKVSKDSHPKDVNLARKRVGAIIIGLYLLKKRIVVY